MPRGRAIPQGWPRSTRKNAKTSKAEIVLLKWKNRVTPGPLEILGGLGELPFLGVYTEHKCFIGGAWSKEIAFRHRRIICSAIYRVVRIEAMLPCRQGEGCLLRPFGILQIMPHQKVCVGNAILKIDRENGQPYSWPEWAFFPLPAWNNCCFNANSATNWALH